MRKSMRAVVAAGLFGALLLGCGGKKKGGEDAGMCESGREGCACLEDGLCLGDLMCVDGLCAGFDSVGLIVTDPDARSCEVVLVEQDTEVLGVTFGEGVQGTSVSEPPRTAVAFHQRTDESFAAGAVTVREATGVAGTIDLRRARCFDREGTALAGEPLRLDR